MRNSFTRYGNALWLSSLYWLNQLIKFGKTTLLKHIIFVCALMLNGLQLFAQWKVTQEREMPMRANSCCVSKDASPTERMDFPYSDVKGWLAVGCDADSEWAYVGFTTAPKLQNTTIEDDDGYAGWVCCSHHISTRITFDDEVEQITMTQATDGKWNSQFIHFKNDSAIIEKLMTADTVSLELDWYGQGKVHFRFSGSGSTRAINQIRQSCK